MRESEETLRGRLLHYDSSLSHFHSHSLSFSPSFSHFLFTFFPLSRLLYNTHSQTHCLSLKLFSIFLFIFLLTQFLYFLFSLLLSLSLLLFLKSSTITHTLSRSLSLFLSISVSVSLSLSVTHKHSSFLQHEKKCLNGGEVVESSLARTVGLSFLLATIGPHSHFVHRCLFWRGPALAPARAIDVIADPLIDVAPTNIKIMECLNNTKRERKCNQS
jgi:hypothetical protein